MDLELNDLLTKQDFDPSSVLLMRHRPAEPELRKVLPWLANERPGVFNAYQSRQPPRVGKQLQKARFVASFISFRAGMGIAGFAESTSMPDCKVWRWRASSLGTSDDFGDSLIVRYLVPQLERCFSQNLKL